MPTVREVRVVAALIADGEGRFLAQQRLPGKARALLWEFPGGKVEAGESEEDALVREGREELDVTLEVGRRVWSTVHDYPDLRVALSLYLARIPSGTPRPLAAHALRFMTPAQMQTVSFCEADEPLIRALAEGKLP